MNDFHKQYGDIAILNDKTSSLLIPKIIQDAKALPDISSSNKFVEIFNITNGDTSIFPSGYGSLIYLPVSWSSREKIMIFIGHTNSGIWTSYSTTNQKGSWVKV